MVRFECAFCGEPSEKKLKDFNRTEKRGNPQCCCRSCSNKLAEQKRNGEKPMRYYVQRPSRVWSDEKRKAKKANRLPRECLSEWDITEEYLQELWKEQRGICPYSRIKMILPDYPNRNKYWSETNLANASLDRIDSNIGYKKGNVEFVALGVNLLKNDYSREEVIQFCEQWIKL